jgi:ABC-2 type transport system ATP-binding protein
MMHNFSIHVRDLSKRFGKTFALSSISADFYPGQITALLGPNGSGKTTFLRIISGLLDGYTGSISVSGCSGSNYSSIIKNVSGYVPDTPAVYDSLTPMEIFRYIGAIRGVSDRDFRERLDRLCTSLDLYPYVERFTGDLSFGIRQKISIVSALLHDPGIIIMDESLNGLDPKSIGIVRDMLIEMGENGRTVILATHSLELAESLCTNMIVLKEGRLAGQSRIYEKSGNSDENALLREKYMGMTTG